MFEFGFFTPDEKAVNRRFLGIWYHKQNNPKIVVWVANRDKPLLDSYGYLVVDDSDAKLLDRNGVAYWSTDDVLSEHKQSMGPIKHYKVTSNEPSRFQLLTGNATDVSNKTRNLIRLCLLNNGNLILGDRRVKRAPLWQSFEHPTDTLLPGMVADGSLSLLASSKLVSWQNHNNPALGKFSFPLQLVTPNDLYIAKRGVPNYWQSGTTPFDKIPSALSGLWNNGNSSLQNNTRLVMNFTGQIQLWNWESERGWSLNWSEPKDGCRLYDKCGRFGSCNSNNGLLCKCLPGFKPTAKWKLGDSSGGCSQKSGPACDRNDSTLNDIFLTFPMMKLGNRTCKVSTSSEGTCRGRCLSDCTCVAYFEGHADCSGPGTLTENKCLTWTELTDLQEESPDGITILVRTTRDDIDPTLRACNHCGTYIIPYPLSTGGNCGNPSYSHFHCNKQTGQVHFSTPSGNFRVNSIDPDNKLFSIQAWKMWNEDQGLELMDPKLNESCIYSEVLRCIHIGLLCVQEDPSDRPSMSTVVHMLSAENASLPPAKQPAFMNRRPLSENASTSSAKDSSGHEVMSVSTVGR
ncbi:hypothetical protein BVRB_5g117630 [Beta vulgaris subsp. vulgaris]|nr:hypothetical protein BVRB_5g117630 [Beta vulgaris subsp. vulgaris]